MTNRIPEQMFEYRLLQDTKSYGIIALVPEGDEPVGVGAMVNGHTYIIMGPRDNPKDMRKETTKWAKDRRLNFCYMRSALMNRKISEAVQA